VTQLDQLGYPIVIDDGVAAHVAAFAERRGYRTAIVLADANVALRAKRVARALGAKTQVLEFALGERRKTLRTLERVLEALAAAGAERRTLIVGVGGGVAGDLFGFAAATYMRGVAFVNVATSLVAMVDAAIGGKTGVDLRAGKNLAGVFRDPAAVFCDIGALATLPERHMREGLAEVLKHAIIEGDEVFDSLESLGVKAAIVSEDRLEAGVREALNLGHTFGHAYEVVSAYRISHGNAVAVGLRAAGLLALRTGRFSATEHLRVLSLLALLRLPMIGPVDDATALLAAMGADKKTRDGKLRFVVPRALGDVEFGVTVPARTVRAVLGRLREAPGVAEFR
jgi:3-dehydroquinate synthetase